MDDKPDSILNNPQTSQQPAAPPPFPSQASDLPAPTAPPPVFLSQPSQPADQTPSPPQQPPLAPPPLPAEQPVLTPSHQPLPSQPPLPAAVPSAPVPLAPPLAPAPSAALNAYPASTPAGPSAVKPKAKWLVPIIILAIVVVAGGAIASVLPSGKSNRDTSKSSNSAVVTGANCGTVTTTAETINDSPFTACFDEHFQECSAAGITASTDLGDGQQTTLKYQIKSKSKSSSSCLVEWQYVALPANPAREGKPIICPYDYLQDFKTAFATRANFDGCSGPLLAVMNGGAN